jgi:hypothetical protein
MQEANYGDTDTAMGTGGNGDEQLLVKFYLTPKQDMAASKLANRPIFADRLYISKKIPGDKSSEINRPVRDADKTRFPRHWAAYEARESQEVIGTPLSEWTGITRSMVEEFRYLNIMTLEQLANMSDANSQGIMGIQALKEKAKKYLETAAEGAAAEALRAQLAERDEKIDALMARLEALENDVPTEELTQGQKAAATRARNKALKEAEQE